MRSDEVHLRKIRKLQYSTRNQSDFQREVEILIRRLMQYVELFKPLAILDPNKFIA